MIQEPFVEQKIDKTYNISPMSQSIKIDGFINEIAWNQIDPIVDFIQEEPNNLSKPSEKTKVYLTYDEESLYIAAYLYDSDPSKIVRQLAPKDDWYGAFDEVADWFSVDIDSRHDHRSGFSFAVNASGVMSDEMIYNDRDYDNDWNAVWQSEVQINDDGWSVEIEIPFSNLPFYEENDMLWGINFSRFIQRKYESISWVVLPLDVEGVVSKYGHLSGLKGIYPPAKFEFKPYSMIGNTMFSDIRLSDYEDPNSHKLNYPNVNIYDLGLDFKYRISTNSKLTFTFNPDFGQVESDPADINLTAYETYFEEKRPFFVDDVDIFRTPIEIFYSRRIGEKAWNEGVKVYEGSGRGDNDTLYYDIPVFIKVASKLTGKTQSGLSYAILAASTSLEDSSTWSNQIINSKSRNYFVTRFKKEFSVKNSNVSIGSMTTSSIINTNNIFSIDGMLSMLDNQINIESQYINGLNNTKGLYGNISYYPFGIFSGWIDYHNYGKGLNINSLGYLWRDDYLKTKFGLKMQTLERINNIKNASVILEYEIEQNTEKLNLGKTIETNFDIRFKNYWGFSGGLYKIIEHYDDRKIILDYELGLFGPSIKIPEVNGYHFSIASNKHSPIWAEITLTKANNTLNDSEKGNYIQLNYKPSPHLSFSSSLDSYHLIKQNHWLESMYEDLDSSYHHMFSDLNRKINSFTFRTNFNVNKKLSFRSYFELYSNHDIFNQNSYSEYIENTSSFNDSTSYIFGVGKWMKDGDSMRVYTQDLQKFENELSYLDPNLYNGFYTRYTSLVINGIIKWNFMQGSNIYFVYSANKSINGKPFNSFSQLNDFLGFNRKEQWVELLRDQSFMIKIDYWFEK